MLLRRSVHSCTEATHFARFTYRRARLAASSAIGVLPQGCHDRHQKRRRDTPHCTRRQWDLRHPPKVPILTICVMLPTSMSYLEVRILTVCHSPFWRCRDPFETRARLNFCVFAVYGVPSVPSVGATEGEDVASADDVASASATEGEDVASASATEGEDVAQSTVDVTTIDGVVWHDNCSFNPTTTKFGPRAHCTMWYLQLIGGITKEEALAFWTVSASPCVPDRHSMLNRICYCNCNTEWTAAPRTKTCNAAPYAFCYSRPGSYQSWRSSRVLLRVARLWQSSPHAWRETSPHLRKPLSLRSQRGGGSRA
jgi:hypothetical protein